MSVTVVHWNPSRVGGSVGRLLTPVVGRTNNFGDLLGPLIVDEIVRQRRLTHQSESARVLAVGSIMKLARPGDVVWGAGVNGKSADHGADYSDVDVRAVRGPISAAWLRERGADVPEVFGDPGLLMSTLWPADREPCRRVTVIPNLHDAAMFRSHPDAVMPRRPLRTILRAILESELVVGSSLHAIVLAEAYGVPARLVRPGHEPLLKYDDYYRGTGREAFTPAETVEDATRHGGEEPPTWDPAPLLDAFPNDLWTSSVMERP